MNFRNQLTVLLLCSAFLASCGGGGSETDLNEPQVSSDPLLPVLLTDSSEEGLAQYWSCNDNIGGDGLVLSFWDEVIQEKHGRVTHNAAAVAKSESATAESWEWQSTADGGEAIDIVATNLVLAQPDANFQLTTLQFDEQNNTFSAFDNRNSTMLTCERQVASVSSFCEFWGDSPVGTCAL